MTIIEDTMEIRFKRSDPHVIVPERGEDSHSCKDKSRQTDIDGLHEQLSRALCEFQSMGRLNDFKHVLKSISDGLLRDNIVFHLLLDLGQLYGSPTIHRMRYSHETLSFWVIFQKLLKGKGINFFLGYKAGNLVLSKFRVDADSPGILEIPLDTFSQEKSGQKVKLSVDGKKIATEFGRKLGGRLEWYEESPTLNERKLRHEAEKKNLHNVLDIVQKSEKEDIAAPNPNIIRQALMIAMNNASARVRVTPVCMQKGCRSFSWWSRYQGIGLIASLHQRLAFGKQGWSSVIPQSHTF